MLKKKEFFNYVKANVGGYLAPKFQDSNISLHTVIKSNDRKLTALVIDSPKEKSPAVPCIYLDDYYDRYSNGAHLLNLLDEIAGCRNLYEDIPGDVDLDIIRHYSAARDKLVIKMCDPSLNKELLQDKVYTLEGELAALYYVNLGTGSEMMGMAAIDHAMLQMWDVSTVQLRKDALLAELSRGYALYTMENLLCSMGGVEEKKNLLEQSTDDRTALIVSSTPMYVLTNNTMVCGASAVMHSQIMDQVCAVIGSDQVYVLPSSIHEVLLLPVNEGADASMLTDLVKEVNSTQVGPEDLLSYKVQIYDSTTHQFNNAADSSSLKDLPA